MELWDEVRFNVVGSAVGNPLFTNKLTKERNRTTYVRMCVEIIVVDNKRACDLPIEYNWRPPKCEHCKTFGHTIERCSSKTKNVKTTIIWLMKERTLVKENTMTFITQSVR